MASVNVTIIIIFYYHMLRRTWGTLLVAHSTQLSNLRRWDSMRGAGSERREGSRGPVGRDPKVKVLSGAATSSLLALS